MEWLFSNRLTGTALQRKGRHANLRTRLKQSRNKDQQSPFPTDERLYVNKTKNRKKNLKEKEEKEEIEICFHQHTWAIAWQTNQKLTMRIVLGNLHQIFGQQFDQA